MKKRFLFLVLSSASSLFYGHGMHEDINQNIFGNSSNQSQNESVIHTEEEIKKCGEELEKLSKMITLGAYPLASKILNGNEELFSSFSAEDYEGGVLKDNFDTLLQEITKKFEGVSDNSENAIRVFRKLPEVIKPIKKTYQKAAQDVFAIINPVSAKYLKDKTCDYLTETTLHPPLLELLKTRQLTFALTYCENNFSENSSLEILMHLCLSSISPNPTLHYQKLTNYVERIVKDQNFLNVELWLVHELFAFYLECDPGLETGSADFFNKYAKLFLKTGFNQERFYIPFQIRILLGLLKTESNASMFQIYEKELCEHVFSQCEEPDQELFISQLISNFNSHFPSEKPTTDLFKYFNHFVQKMGEAQQKRIKNARGLLDNKKKVEEDFSWTCFKELNAFDLQKLLGRMEESWCTDELAMTLSPYSKKIKEQCIQRLAHFITATSNRAERGFFKDRVLDSIECQKIFDEMKRTLVKLNQLLLQSDLETFFSQNSYLSAIKLYEEINKKQNRECIKKENNFILNRMIFMFNKVLTKMIKLETVYETPHIDLFKAEIKEEKGHSKKKKKNQTVETEEERFARQQKEQEEKDPRKKEPALAQEKVLLDRTKKSMASYESLIAKEKAYTKALEEKHKTLEFLLAKENIGEREKNKFFNDYQNLKWSSFDKYQKEKTSQHLDNIKELEGSLEKAYELYNKAHTQRLNLEKELEFAINKLKSSNNPVIQIEESKPQQPWMISCDLTTREKTDLIVCGLMEQYEDIINTLEKNGIALRGEKRIVGDLYSYYSETFTADVLGKKIVAIHFCGTQRYQYITRIYFEVVGDKKLSYLGIGHYDNPTGKIVKTW